MVAEEQEEINAKTRKSTSGDCSRTRRAQNAVPKISREKNHFPAAVTFGRTPKISDVIKPAAFSLSTVVSDLFLTICIILGFQFMGSGMLSL
jgi:hypothetical protein